MPRADATLTGAGEDEVPFGFRPAAELRIDPLRPDGRPWFLVRPLTGYTPALRGTFSYLRLFTSG